MLKRLFDIVVSLIGLVILSPVLLILGAWVKLSSPGPIFYRSSRVGRDGVEFKLLKFRSMVINADKLGPPVTGAHDPRITRVGRILRGTKMDELPQLWNVLVGEMSLVGPRPEAPKYVAYYTPTQRAVLRVRPGITGPASIRYRHEEEILTGENWEEKYIREVMPAKLEIDLEYARHVSLARDVILIFLTFLALFR
ncbi:MAG: sugar transferase [Chloroflexi bacterium]|nr:sugar transferase [Chloroflexota bacterium]